jgi:hypothetical protein
LLGDCDDGVVEGGGKGSREEHGVVFGERAVFWGDFADDVDAAFQERAAVVVETEMEGDACAGGGSADFLEGREFDVERRGGAGDDALESLYLEELSLEGATEVSFG